MKSRVIRWRHAVLAVALAWPMPSAAADDELPERHPLLDVPKDRSTAEHILRAPATIAEFPFRLLGSGLEGTLDWAENADLLRKAMTFPAWLGDHHLLVTGGNQGDGSGLGAGAGVFANLGHGRLLARTQWTVRDYRTHTLELYQPLSRSVLVHAWGRDRRRPGDEFFGLGPDSRGDDETSYRLDSVDTGLRLRWRRGGWALILGGGWTDWDAPGRGEGDEHPATIDAFPDLDGLGGASLASGVLTVRYPVVLYRGGRAPESGLEASLRVVRDTDGDAFGFSRYSLTLYRVIPLFRGDRVLALRAWATMTDRQAGRTVPFWELADIGGSRGLRGYDSLRFRDLDATLFNVEYRFPVWDIGLASGLGLDAVLFWDGGLVAPGLEDARILADLETDFGFGFRVRHDRASVARMSVAFGGEENFRIEFKTGRDF